MIWSNHFIPIRYPAYPVRKRVLRVKTTKKKKDSPIEKVSILSLALEIVLLSYLYLSRDKPYNFYLLGHERVYGYTVSAQHCLLGFLLFPRDNPCSLFLLGHKFTLGYTLYEPSQFV